MITKVVINNNEDTPIEYLSGLRAFKNGKGYVQTEGEMMPDPKQVFTMLDIKYHTKDLQRLIRAINVAGVKQAKILNHEDHRLYIEAGSAQILIAGVEEEVWGEVIKVI